MQNGLPEDPSLPPGPSRPGLFDRIRRSLGLPIATLALVAAVAALLFVLLIPPSQPADPILPPTITPAPPPTSTAAPSPTPTLAPGVNRIIVGRFSGSDGEFEVAEAIEGALVAASASEGLSGDVQVALIPDEITSHQQARLLLDTYGAALAIWGRVEPDGVRAHTTLARVGPPDLPRVHGLPQPNPLFFPHDLEFFLTRDLGADMTFLALATIGQLDLAGEDTAAARERFQSSLLTMPAALPRDARDRGVGIVRFYYGLIALEEGDPLGALQSYSLALRLYPELDSTFNNRGTVYFALGDYQAALDEFDTVLQADPQNTVVLGNRALARLALGQPDNALLDAERLVTLAPDDSYSANLRGLIHYARAEYEDALTDFARAAELAPESAAARFNRAVTLDALGMGEEAIEAYSALLERWPDDTLARIYRGDTYLNLGRDAEAVTDYDEALKIDLNSIYGYQQRASFYIARENYSVALVDLETALSVGDDPRTFTLLGQLHAAQGELDIAEAAYDDALALDPANADALAGRGATRRSRRSFVGARDDLEAALAFGPPSTDLLPGLLLDLGFVYFEQGQYEESLEALEDALEIGVPDPAIAYAGLAISLESQSRRDEAEFALAMALDLDPRLANLDALAEEPGWTARALVRLQDILARTEG